MFGNLGIKPMIGILESRLNQLYEIQSKAWDVPKNTMFLVIYFSVPNKEGKTELMSDIRTSAKPEKREEFSLV